jgi:hypothetical protein
MLLDVLTVSFCFLAMLFSFLACREFHRHAHEPAGRRAGYSRFHPGGHADSSSGDTAARQAADPSECPLCDKRCILARPRCKHGEAFIQFMRANHAGASRIQDL